MQWTGVSKSLGKRFGHSMSAFDNFVVIFGGFSQKMRVNNQLIVYDTEKKDFIKYRPDSEFPNRLWEASNRIEEKFQ